MSGDDRYPQHDGWRFVYDFYSRYIRPRPFLRRLARAYFAPTAIERAGDGRPFRVLGVPLFGRFVPTGGVEIRRITGWRMQPYTSKSSSLRAARDFFYRACVFEGLHFPFFVALLILTVDRLSSGRFDLAAKDLLVNILVNGYPMIHHRRTRFRILGLLQRKAIREGSQGQCGLDLLR